MCKALDDIRTDGIEKGIEKLITLIKKMSEAGEAAQIPRLSSEPDFLESCYKKYGV